MRTTRLLLTAALLVSPALASAQTAQTGTCLATTPAGATPNCSLTRSVTSTVANILKLSILDTTAIDLVANDSLAYQKTRLAAGGAGTTGSQVGTPASLQAAANFDSVIVLANRGYTLTLNALSPIFDFDKDANYGQCRFNNLPSFSTTCGAATGTAGKPIGDLYWKLNTGGTFSQMSTTAAAGNVRNNPTGERFTAKIYYSSAWFYATDIPGQYAARLQYTLAGQ